MAGTNAVKRWTQEDARQTGAKLSLLHPDNSKIWLQGGYSSVELARRNFADGTKLDAIGTLAIGANYMRGDGDTNYFASNQSETIDWTVLIFGRMPDVGTSNANRGTFIGNFNGAADVGFLAYQSSATQIRTQCRQAVNTQKVVLLTIPDPEQNKRFAIVCDSSIGSFGRLTVYNRTDGTSAFTDLTAARETGALLINVLSSHSGAFTGYVEANHISYHADKSMSLIEIDEMFVDRIVPWSTADSFNEHVS